MTKFLGQVTYLLTQVNTWLVAAGVTVTAAGMAAAQTLPNPAATWALTVASALVGVLGSAALIVRRSLTIANDPGARFVPSTFDESYAGQYDNADQDW